VTVTSRVVVFAAFVMLCAGIAPLAGTAASPPSCNAELQVLRIPASSKELDATRFLEKSELLRLVRERKVQSLEAATAVGLVNDSIPILVGRKVPVVYTDPRSGGSQVQYTDVGLKALVNVTAEAGDRFSVYVKAERTALVEDDAAPWQTSRGFMAAAQFLVRPTQVALFARTRGMLTPQAMKHAYPGVPFAEGDSLVLALSVDYVR